MKKNLCKIVALVISALLVMCSAAFADAAMGTPTVSEQKVTVTLTGLQAEEEATILVVNAGVTLASVTTEDIIFIDQLTSDKDGNVTFELDASATKEVDGKKIVDIYSGYSTMTLTSPLSTTGFLVSGTAADPILYGDVNGDGEITATDKIILARYLAEWEGVVINEANSDVNGDSDITATDKIVLARHLAEWPDYLVLPIK